MDIGLSLLVMFNFLIAGPLQARGRRVFIVVMSVQMVVVVILWIALQHQ